MSERRWSIRCPDGAQWDDIFESEESARKWVSMSDETCDCELGAGHQLIVRYSPEWQVAE